MLSKLLFSCRDDDGRGDNRDDDDSPSYDGRGDDRDDGERGDKDGCDDQIDHTMR